MGAAGALAGLSLSPVVFWRSEPPASGDFDDGATGVRNAGVADVLAGRRSADGRASRLALGTWRDLGAIEDSWSLGERGVEAGRGVRSGAT